VAFVILLVMAGCAGTGTQALGPSGTDAGVSSAPSVPATSNAPGTAVANPTVAPATALPVTTEGEGSPPDDLGGTSEPALDGPASSAPTPTDGPGPTVTETSAAPAPSTTEPPTAPASTAAPTTAPTTPAPTTAVPTTATPTTAAPDTTVAPTTAEGDPLRLMYLGDSITRGYVSGNSWRYYVGRNLVIHDAKVDSVGPARLEDPGGSPFFDLPWDLDHNSHAGLPATFYIDCVSLCGQRCAADPNVCNEPVVRQWIDHLGEYNPDMIVALLGSIDLTWTGEVTPPILANSLREMVIIAQRHNPNVDVLLLELAPLSSDFYTSDDGINDYQNATAKIDQTNALIRGLGASLSTATSKVVVADVSGGLDSAKHYVDGIHFNASGSQVVGRNISELLFTDFGIGGPFDVPNPCESQVCPENADG
jgi:lysophospholipase L1-like esterase